MVGTLIRGLGHGQVSKDLCCLSIPNATQVKAREKKLSCDAQLGIARLLAARGYSFDMAADAAAVAVQQRLAEGKSNTELDCFHRAGAPSRLQQVRQSGAQVV